MRNFHIIKNGNWRPEGNQKPETKNQLLLWIPYSTYNFILNESKTKFEHKNVCFQWSFNIHIRIFSQLHFHPYHRLQLWRRPIHTGYINSMLWGAFNSNFIQISRMSMKMLVQHEEKKSKSREHQTISSNE